MSEATLFELPDQRAYRMALLLKALEDLDREMVSFKTDWKKRQATLEQQLSDLKYAIISGQKPLFEEPAVVITAKDAAPPAH